MKKTIAVLLVWCLLLTMLPGGVLAANAADNTPPSPPTGLMMETSNQPLGIEEDTPAMSWIVNDADKDEVQTAYQILIATTQEKLTEEAADVWDSGKVESSESSQALYTGDPIPANGRYYWTVRTYDKAGAVSGWAEPQLFTTAVGGEWTASAIWAGDSGGKTDSFADMGYTDYTMEADFWVNSKAIGFSFRKPSDANKEDSLYMMQINTSSLFRPHYCIDNAWSAPNDLQVNLKDYGITINTGEKHHIKLSAVGNEIKAWVDDVLVTTLNWSWYDSGTFGIRCGAGESGYIDNLKIYQPDGTMLYENDFSTDENPFVGGGKIEDGRYLISSDERLFHGVRQGNNQVVFLRREFTVEKPVERAIVSAIGKDPDSIGSYTFKMYLNGAYAGAGSPRAVQDGVHGNLYNTYDVTNLIRQGENCIGAINYSTGSDKRFQMQMKLFYEDGTTETVATDSTWTGLDGTQAFGDNGTGLGGGFYIMAENIDARAYPYGWNEAGFDDSAWSSAAVKDTITNLTASQVETMRQVEMPVEKIVDKGDGSYFLQLQKEVVGSLRLTLPDGVDGQVMTVLYGEELSGENTVRWQMRSGNTYREYWTLKDGPQQFEGFGIKCFRYVEIQNCPVEITADMVKGIAMQQEFDEEDSGFISSSEVLNDVWELCKYTIEATNQNLYTDSMTRERTCYEGDNYINQLTSYAVSRNYNLARYSTQYVLYKPTWPIEYLLQTVMTAWDDYLYTGNTALIEEYYDKLVGQLRLGDYDESVGLFRSPLSGTRPIVDWPPENRDGYDVDNTPYNTVVNCYEYYCLRLIAQMAELTGRADDAEKYRTMAENLKKAINELLLDPEDGFYIEGLYADKSPNTGKAFATSIYPLLHGLVDDETQREVLGEFLANGGMKSNVFTAQFLLQALYQGGEAQAALDLLTDTGIKSWGHMIYDLDATITTELFDPSQGFTYTYSHPWASSPGNVIVRDMFGIKPLEPSFNKLQIRPQPADLDYVSLKTPTIKGPVMVDISEADSQYAFEMTTTTPANTTAKVYVPAAGVSHNIVLVDGTAMEAVREGDFFVFDQIGSGTHTFQVPAGAKMTLTVNGTCFAGSSRQLSVSVTNEDGTAVDLNGVPIVYQSDREEVLTIGTDGMMNLLSAGKSTVTVRAVLPNVLIAGVEYRNYETSASLVVEVIATDDLESAIAQFEDYEPGNYTEASVQAVQPVLTEAKALLESGEFSKEQLADMAAQLRRAYASMEPAYPIDLSGAQRFGTSPSYQNRADNTFAAAWDGSLSTSYDYHTTDGGLTGIDFGEGNAQRIAVIRYYPRNDEALAWRMVGGRFEGSNDGEIWDTLYTITEEPAYAWTQVPVYSAQAYRYLRYVSSNNCNVAEIALYAGGSGQAKAVAERAVIPWAESIDLTPYSEQSAAEFIGKIDALKALIANDPENSEAIYAQIEVVQNGERYLAPEGVEYCFLTLKSASADGGEKVRINAGTAQALPGTFRLIKGETVTLEAACTNDVDYGATGWYDESGTLLSGDRAYVFTAQEDLELVMETGWIGYENLAVGADVSANSIHTYKTLWQPENLTDGQLVGVEGNLGFTSIGSAAKDVDIWVELDLGENKTMDRVQLYPRTDAFAADGSTASFPETFKLQIRRDGESEYTTVGEWTGFQAPYLKPAVLQLSESYDARYVRLSVSRLGEAPAGEQYFLQLAEMGVYNTRPAFKESIEAPETVTQNELFEVTAVTGDDVEKVALFNEYGLKVSTRDLVRTDNGDGTVTWTFRTAIGTVGTGRVLTLAVAADGQYTLTDAAFTVDVKAVKPVVVSATIEETAVVNEPVTLTVVTGKEVRKLEIRNEFGLKMGILSSAYQDMDGNRVWTVQTKIGTRGVRQFTVSGKNAYGDVSDAVTTNPVTVRAF